jgi:DNA-directed RNA polymerase subunit RPC12/RpoP
MSNQRLQSLGFGPIDRPACPYCGERAYLTRRSPHPDYGLHYEQQLFICSACDHTIERIVGAGGDPLK